MDGSMQLPILRATSAPAACSRLDYLSGEELGILVKIRELGEMARTVRRERDAAAARGDAAAHAQACAALESLRAQRTALEPEREHAWRRKMIALGHLEDESPLEPRP